MKSYNERKKTQLLSKQEIEEIEKIKDEVIEFIKKKTYSNPKISVDVQFYITDKLGSMVCKDRYLSLL